MGTYAKVVADSISPAGIRLTTMELCFHRFILPEFNTHRMFSRNAASSRAIPTQKLLDQVRDEPAMPMHWGKNQPGMQAREEIEDNKKAISKWDDAAFNAATLANRLDILGVHKQVTNRLLEPFMWVKVIVTATEWDNFFDLRLHPAAQPEMALLASKMREAMDESNPKWLTNSDWHLPYIKEEEADVYTNELMRKCSAARCARVSYLNHDNTEPDTDKDIALADRLLKDGHMSPFEHQASPMGSEGSDWYDDWIEKGVTHIDKEHQLWSGNFRGWVQYRQLLGETS